MTYLNTNIDKTILVTGASRGIGKAIALRLAREGYRLAIHCRSQHQALKTVADDIEALGSQAVMLQFDIANRVEARQCLEQYIAEYGVPYGIVCNAGIARDAAFPALTNEDWDSVIHTNLDGFYNVLHPLVLPMVAARKPGRIVTLASVSGLTGNRGQVNYSAAKSGIIGATKALAIELAKRQITVNCVAPGLIETEMVSEEVLAHALKLIPMQRAGQVEEVAAVVNFLMQTEAAYITRQVISVNGGMV